MRVAPEPTPAASRLFAYGTLTFRDVIEALLGRPMDPIPAQLLDHACRPVRAAPFPAVVAASGERSDGRLYTGLGARDWELLDRFEGELYRREVRRIALWDPQRHELDVTLYLPTRALSERIVEGHWSPARFRSSQLRRYTAICRSLRHRFERGL